MAPLKILVVASEVVPFAKTGGLADVAGALPLELARMGHDVRVAMPKYGSIDDDKYHLLPILGDIHVRLGTLHHIANIKRTVFPDSNVPVYFVVNDHFFDRAHLYVENGTDYPDNAERFAFFCKAVIWLLKGLDWVPDIIHCNDWQTALVPVYLRTDHEMRADGSLSRVRVLYTIHNLAYQGLFASEEAARIGIGPELFHPAALEFYGALNLMKGGLLYSDRLSTVSQRYAEEIQTAEFGCGLEGVLTMRRAHLTGILNGIDYNLWNPGTDEFLPAHYSRTNIADKAKCKAALQQECGLPVRADVPLLSLISRLDSQKGLDLVAQILDQLLRQEVQFVMLGTGAPEYHRLFERLAAQNPTKMCTRLAFDNGFAHRIEAGADIFLMPSRYEPCGLNQLYSLRYGTIPVVRHTGGLADSITDAKPEAIADDTGTGFVFEEYDSLALLAAIERALATYSRKSQWQKLVQNAMAKDFSWTTSAKKYEALFREMVAK